MITHEFYNRGKNWFVYVVEAQDGRLYTGVTTDLDRRMKEHQSGKKGAKFFRSSSFKALVYQQDQLSRGEALSLEHKIKQMSRSEKLAFISQSSV